MTTKIWRVEYGGNAFRVDVTARNFIEAAKKGRVTVIKEARKDSRIIDSSDLNWYNSQPVTEVSLIAESDN
jgi:hypothetical protein